MWLGHARSSWTLPARRPASGHVLLESSAWAGGVNSGQICDIMRVCPGLLVVFVCRCWRHGLGHGRGLSKAGSSEGDGGPGGQACQCKESPPFECRL